jgi:hypothetical protein
VTRRVLSVVLALLCTTVFVTGVVQARLAEQLARDAGQRAERSASAARRAALDAAGAGELAASCEAQARADLDAAHARIRAIESSLRAVAATNPCRVRLPRPIEDLARPLWCEDRTSWWATPLPTLGAGCYPAEARVLDWSVED